MRLFPRHSFNLVIQFMDHPFFLVKQDLLFLACEFVYPWCGPNCCKMHLAFRNQWVFLNKLIFYWAITFNVQSTPRCSFTARLNHFLSSAGITSNYLCVWQKTFFCSQREMYVKGRTGHIKCKSHILLVHFTFYDRVSWEWKEQTGNRVNNIWINL